MENIKYYQVLSGGTLDGCFNVEYSKVATRAEARRIAAENQEQHGGLWIIASVY